MSDPSAPGATSPYPPLTAEQEARLRSAISRQFSLSPSYGDACAPCAAGDAIGAMVRLPFHDASGGGGPAGAEPGGPNGCIDPATAANDGLLDVIANLDAAREAAGLAGPAPPAISRADLWVLAGAHAIQLASTVGNATAAALSGLPLLSSPLVLPVRYGRADAAACSTWDTGRLPAPTFSYADTIARFGAGGGGSGVAAGAGFGMTPTEVTAILGAHTLGRAEAANSGFEGGWTASQSSFSNAFYVLMLQAPWDESATVRDQWDGNATLPGSNGVTVPILLFRSDVEMALATSLPGNNDTCPVFEDDNPVVPKCPHTAGYDTVARFVQSTDAWFSEFTPAWQKMTESNYAFNGSRLIRGFVPSPSAVPVPVPGATAAAAQNGGLVAAVVVLALVAAASLAYAVGPKAVARLRGKRGADYSTIDEKRPFV